MRGAWLDNLARRMAGGPSRRATDVQTPSPHSHAAQDLETDEEAVSRRHLLTRAGAVSAAAAATVLPGWSPAFGAQCRPGRKRCSGRCVNLKTSENHCGACGNKCKDSQYCSKGKCCKKGLTNCRGRCVNLKNNSNHCGRCGNNCADNETCVNGECQEQIQCGAGETLCGGVCVDTDTNPQHCGACNNNCADGVSCTTDVCSDGICSHVPNDAVCSNGNGCDGFEVCDPNFGCVAGTPPTVDDGNACTNDVCDPETGQVSHSQIMCEDNNPCTTSTCDPQTGCVHTPVVNGTTCPGGVCQNGTCGPECQTANDCNDNNPCTVATCQGNACFHSAVQNGTACPGGTCNNGICNTCAGAGQPCQVGVGACTRSGTTVCNQNGQAVCNQTPGSPTTEVCNGIDDDCDGQIDEGNPGGGQSCNTGQPGRCAQGTLTCQNGSLVCVRNQNPTAEVCNGIDDDCDGQIDEGNPGGGGACSTGQQGVCSAGTVQCQGGALICVRNVNPSTEVCNGLDDDCDGQVDEGNPGGGGACTHACGPGTINCIGGTLQCVPNNPC